MPRQPLPPAAGDEPPAGANREPGPEPQRWRAAVGRLRDFAYACLGPSALPWPVVTLASAYLGVLAVRFGRILGGIRWFSDAVWAPVLIRRQLRGFAGGQTYVGETAHFSTLALLWLTRSLPLRSVLWEVFPVVLALATAALLGWAVARISERWAGWLSFGIAVAAAPPLLFINLAQGLRGHTHFSIVAMSAVLVVLVQRKERIFDRGSVAAVFACCFVGGIALASDAAFLTFALVPFFVAGVTPWLLKRTREHVRLALVVCVVVAVSIALAIGARAGAQAIGFRATYPGSPYTFAALQQMFTNFAYVIVDILALGNAYLFGGPLGARTILQLAMGTASLIAVPLVVLMAVRVVRAAVANGEPVSARTVFVVFWATLELAAISQFVMSSLVAGTGVNTIRYLTPVFYAVAATVPLWAVERDWRRVVALSAASLFCFLSTAALLGYPRQQPFDLYAYEANPLVKNASAILNFLNEERVSRGYAGYWNSHPLTYNSDLEIVVNPVIECRRPSKALCRFWVNTRSDWYDVRQTRTFLVVDSETMAAEDPSRLRPPPSGDLGQPVKVGRFGEVSVYIYDYDLAEKIVHLRVPGMD